MKRDDRLRRVVRAGLVPAGDQFLEHLAEHLRIDGHFDIQRGRLGHGEVEAVEQLAQHILDFRVRHDDVGAQVVGVHLEQATVEVRHVAEDMFLHVAALNLGVRLGVQADEEQVVQPVAVKVDAWVGALRLSVQRPQPRQVVVADLARQPQPALLLNEGDEHESVEQPLREQPSRVAIDADDARFDAGEDLAILLVKLLRHYLDIERLVVAFLHRQRRDVLVLRAERDLGELFAGRAQPFAEALVRPTVKRRSTRRRLSSASYFTLMKRQSEPSSSEKTYSAYGSDFVSCMTTSRSFLRSSRLASSRE